MSLAPGKLAKSIYDDELKKYQFEVVRLQYWVKKRGQRLVVIFEGRDAAGKGGTIKRLVDPLNPRGVRLVALPKPSDVESTQWYFQRYIAKPSEAPTCRSGTCRSDHEPSTCVCR